MQLLKIKPSYKQSIPNFKKCRTLAISALLACFVSFSNADTSSLTAGSLTASMEGVNVLSADMGEAQVRKMISKGRSGDVFFIEPRSSWTLTATLEIPEGITIIGTNPGGGDGAHPTFIKGFNGPLAHLTRFVTLEGISFDGNKKEFTGDGIVAGRPETHPRNEIREVRLTRVEVKNNAGHGYNMVNHHYFSEFNFCTFDHNDGYGVVYGQVRAHHTDNMWKNCHFCWNKKGGIAFYGMDASSVWENCEFWHNGGAAFDHFLIHKKLGHGKPVGPRPNMGADVLVIRNTVIRNHPGPVWLQREGHSQAIVFEDCRLKHNGNPSNSAFTKDSGKTVQELMGLTGPVSGLFHVEEGQLNVEMRNCFAWNNGEYVFTASSKSVEGSTITISGGGEPGAAGGGVYAPNGYAAIMNTLLLPKDAKIVVKGGFGLDPYAGKTISYVSDPE